MRTSSARRALLCVLAVAFCGLGAARPIHAEQDVQRLKLADSVLATSEDDRERLKYLIGCALPEGAVVETWVGGKHYEFAGELGLAPAWSRRALTPQESRWVSACILARTNWYGVAVQISLRAASARGARLRADAAERARFPLHEGAFFGDIFRRNAPAYVCLGGSSTRREETLRALRRICTLPDGHLTAEMQALSHCGFIIAGSCAAQPYTQADVDYSEEVVHVYLAPLRQ
jgi:hypothetical protein